MDKDALFTVPTPVLAEVVKVSVTVTLALVFAETFPKLIAPGETVKAAVGEGSGGLTGGGKGTNRGAGVMRELMPSSRVIVPFPIAWIWKFPLKNPGGVFASLTTPATVT